MLRTNVEFSRLTFLNKCEHLELFLGPLPSSVLKDLNVLQFPKRDGILFWVLPVFRTTSCFITWTQSFWNTETFNTAGLCVQKILAFKQCQHLPNSQGAGIPSSRNKIQNSCIRLKIVFLTRSKHFSPSYCTYLLQLMRSVFCVCS